MSRYFNDELYHHGIKGMKWGVRRKKIASKALIGVGTGLNLAAQANNLSGIIRGGSKANRIATLGLSSASLAALIAGALSKKKAL